MTTERFKSLQSDLCEAIDRHDYKHGKQLMSLLETEHEKESLRKWVWYR